MDNLRIRERRDDIRFPLSLSVRCFEKKNRIEVLSRTHDISHKGLGLLINEEMPLNSRIDITIIMPDTGEEICATGKIVWQTPVDNYCFRTGIVLLDNKIKPVPIVLRTIQARTSYH